MGWGEGDFELNKFARLIEWSKWIYEIFVCTKVSPRPSLLPCPIWKKLKLWVHRHSLSSMMMTTTKKPVNFFLFHNGVWLERKLACLLLASSPLHSPPFPRCSCAKTFLSFGCLASRARSRRENKLNDLYPAFLRIALLQASPPSLPSLVLYREIWFWNTQSWEAKLFLTDFWLKFSAQKCSLFCWKLLTIVFHNPAKSFLQKNL